MEKSKPPATLLHAYFIAFDEEISYFLIIFVA